MSRAMAIGGLGALLMVASTHVSGQAPPDGQPVFRTGAGEVLVDAVVRDKKGRLIRNLKQGDLRVFENDVEQQVTSFREVHGVEKAGGGTEPTVQSADGVPGTVKLDRQIRLVSLVFEGLSLQGRKAARIAAKDFLQADLGPNVYYAVFYLNRSFRPVLPYTNNRERILAAIDRVTGWEKAPIATSELAFEPPPSGSTGIAALVANGMADSVKAMSAFNRTLDTDMMGAMSIFSIWGIISELGRLPGRKSMIYFSEGLNLSANYRQHYLSMVSAANRANVSIYTIDARGLFVASDMMGVRRELTDAVQTSQDVTTRPATEGSGQFGMRAMGMDHALQSFVSNPQHNLSDLSEKTGGFLIANTNDLRVPMKKLSEEFNTYYEVTYRPADATYDGRFRAITVKASSANATVRARDGYFAVPAMLGQAVFPFEAPLLHALGRPVLPRDLEYRASVLQYRETGGLRQTSLVFDLPLSQITFKRDPAGLIARSYVTFLALVKDSEGQVVAKVSRDLPLEHPSAKVDAFLLGRYTLTRTVALLPGRYTVESAVSDNFSGKQAARKSVLIVAAPNGQPALSDVALVRRVDPLPATPDQEDPLQLSEGRIVPTLTDRIGLVTTGQLTAFVMLYPGPTGPKPAVYVDLMRDGRVVTRTQPTIPVARADGSIPFIANMPIAGVEPGQYELRAAVVQGGKAVTRSVIVNIE